MSDSVATVIAAIVAAAATIVVALVTTSRKAQGSPEQGQASLAGTVAQAATSERVRGCTVSITLCFFLVIGVTFVLNMSRQGDEAMDEMMEEVEEVEEVEEPTEQPRPIDSTAPVDDEDPGFVLPPVMPTPTPTRESLLTPTVSRPTSAVASPTQTQATPLPTSSQDKGAFTYALPGWGGR